MNGSVDAALSAGPDAIRAEKAGARVLTTGEGLVEATIVTAVRGEFLQKHPELVKRFLAAHRATVDSIKTNPEQALALTAAETGHLVFGTLHTSSAAKTVDRIIDVFPAEEKEMVRAMLSESLVAVISQTLCRNKDGSGRVAAHEIMLGTPAIRNLIREAKVAQMYSTIQTSSSMGMQTLDQNLTELVKRNLISPAEARSKAKIPENFPG